MNLPDTLYHYTSLETLFAIINGINNEDCNNVYLKLRATHSSFLNDETEGKLLPNVLAELGVKESLLVILESLQGYPFVVSLTELADDLNMWRSYAGQGCGVAIGLDTVELNELYQFEQIKYTTHSELLNQLKSQGIKQYIGRENVLPLERIIGDALKYKHISFKAEKEWRIYEHSTEDGFRLSSDSIIPYKEINICTSAIRSITLGPKCNYEKNQFSIARMLKNKIPHEEWQQIRLLKSNVPLI